MARAMTAEDLYAIMWIGECAVSPDGTQVAFTVSRLDREQDATLTSIWAVPAAGGRARPFTTGAHDASPRWSPRGEKITLMCRLAGNQICLINPDGSGLQQLTTLGSNEDPAWSPDGQRIAFAWQKSQTSYFDIYVHDLATGRNDQLTQNESNNERPTWAPDGRHIAFESPRRGSTHIYSMLADGTKARQLTQTGKNQGPAWSGYTEH
mgnify:CR=1 FL=1